MSLPLWERGFKQQECAVQVPLHPSLPLWERGFKKKLYREFGLDTLSKENL